MPPKTKGEYIETDSGNRVSRKSQIHGTQNIILGGKNVIQADVCIRGDLRRAPSSDSKDSKGSIAVSVGRYCFFATGCILRPPSKPSASGVTYFPIKIGDHVYVGPDSIVEAASIGSYIEIGRASTIGRLAIIKDYVKILPETVVPPNMVIPSFSIVAGVPARVVAELGDACGDEFDCRDRYRSVAQT